LRSRAALAAENLFLRKQLALFQERERRAVPTTAADRFAGLTITKAPRQWKKRARLDNTHVDRLASSCVPPFLALEVETSRKTADLGRRTALDSSNGS
jgi:hypothetical protein